VKDYVRSVTLRGQEMFVPLTHPPGEAQVDFGEAVIVIAGVEQNAGYGDRHIRADGNFASSCERTDVAAALPRGRIRHAHS
jgi:hypothetical protein